jgi:hypothetical protein
LEKLEKTVETFNLRKWKTEKHHWNAGKLYQWFFLCKRKVIPTRRPGNVKEKFFLPRLFRPGIEEFGKTYPAVIWKISR